MTKSSVVCCICVLCRHAPRVTLQRHGRIPQITLRRRGVWFAGGLRKRVASGRFRLLFPGVYAVGHAPLPAVLSSP
jgi:hypothetical protein